MNDCKRFRSCPLRACWTTAVKGRPRILKRPLRPSWSCRARGNIAYALPHSAPPKNPHSSLNNVVLDRLNPIRHPRQYLPSLPFSLFFRPHTDPTLRPISQPTSTPTDVYIPEPLPQPQPLTHPDSSHQTTTLLPPLPPLRHRSAWLMPHAQNPFPVPCPRARRKP